MYFINISIDPSGINLSNPGWDTFLIILFFIGVLSYSFFANRERLALVLLSVYSSLAISLTTPFLLNVLTMVKPNEYVYWRLGIFLGFFLLLYILFSFNLSLRSEIGHSWFQSFLLSFFQVGLLISSILVFIPKEMYSSQLSTSFFTGDIPRSFWLLAPIVVMMFLRRSREHSPPARQ